MQRYDLSFLLLVNDYILSPNGKKLGQPPVRNSSYQPKNPNGCNTFPVFGSI